MINNVCLINYCHKRFNTAKWIEFVISYEECLKIAICNFTIFSEWFLRYGFSKYFLCIGKLWIDLGWVHDYDVNLNHCEMYKNYVQFYEETIVKMDVSELQYINYLLLWFHTRFMDFLLFSNPKKIDKINSYESFNAS